MKKITFSIGLLLLLVLSILQASAAFAATDHLVISEVLYDPSGSVESGKEWIELYNPTASDIDVSFWTVKKKDDNVFLPTFTFPGGTVIKAHSYFLLGDDGTLPASLPTPDGIGRVTPLSNTAEGIAIFDSTDQVVDAVGWGTFFGDTDFFEGNRLPRGLQTQSLERLQGNVGSSLCGNDIDTNNNDLDFFYQAVPNPKNSSTTVVPCAADTTAPGSVSNLRSNSVTNESITWTWDNPSDVDFSQNIILINGQNLINTSDDEVVVTDLTPFTSYTIVIQTSDVFGNINTNAGTDTETTTENLGVPCFTDNDCSDGLFCNGVEVCSPTTFTCQAGTAPLCDDGVACTIDSCNEASKACVQTPDDSVCNDGLFCNGVEVCHLTNDCQAGTAVDCSINDVTGVSSCTNNPDNNQFTLDELSSFTSSCNEATDSCTTSTDSMTHTCNTAICGATCETNTDCSAGFICDLNSCGCVPSGEPFCGDGTINQGSEQCDGSDLGGLSCLDFGFEAGTLGCGSGTCLADTSGCFNVSNIDTDSDGVFDSTDNCINTSNPGQENDDGDEFGNACDVCPNDASNDADSDGICGEEDFCPLFPGEDEQDNDEVCGNVDNCPSLFNPGQENDDNDQNGNVCDVCPNDAYDDRDNDGICGNLDPITGTNENITTNYNCIEWYVNGVQNPTTASGLQEVKIYECNATMPLTEFMYDFTQNGTNTGIDLYAVTINKSDNPQGFMVSGIDLTAQGRTKNFYVPRLLQTNTLCVLDTENPTLTVSNDCSNGVKLTCDGTASNYACTIIQNGTYYNVSGLSHSAVLEYSFTQTTNTPTTSGGGGGGIRRSRNTCTPDWVCGDWGTCVNSFQDRLCEDKNKCDDTTTMPKTEQRCVVDNPLNVFDDSDGSNSGNNQENDGQGDGDASSNEEDKNAEENTDLKESLLTGAAVTNLKNNGASGSFIMLIFALMILMGSGIYCTWVK